MKKFLNKFIKKFRYNQKGFTLIELLVVVAILGVLAAVIIPNVGRFIGSGTIEAANTEAHNVQSAVVDWMADNTANTFAGDVGPATSNGPEVYLINPSNLQAVYTFAGGAITSASPITDSKWGSLAYDPAQGGWYQP
jgi:type IV pilus assembly protein PilA